MHDDTELLMTFPNPVAFTATAPDPATPTVRARIPALDSVSSSIMPVSETTLSHVSMPQYYCLLYYR
jgi:hypothetical protein